MITKGAQAYHVINMLGPLNLKMKYFTRLVGHETYIKLFQT